MTLLLLIRHAENDWVRTGRLAGWTPEVHLNDEGRRQADALGERLAKTKLQAIYSSPLERAVETAQAVLTHHPDTPLQLEQDVGEVDFGDWTGKRLRQLSRTRLWETVQNAPSLVRFPNGESFSEMQLRTTRALQRIAAIHPQGTIAIFSHSDVIKAIFAYYAGIHLDLFQRITVSPASITTIALANTGVRIIGLNDTSHYSQRS